MQHSQLHNRSFPVRVLMRTLFVSYYSYYYQADYYYLNYSRSLVMPAPCFHLKGPKNVGQWGGGYIYMSPIPFGLMRLGILSSIINTQANFYYTLFIFIHVDRQVLHMTRIAYIIYYMPYTLCYIPLMIYHVLYIRCYILSITYYILYVLRWTICIVVYVIHHILNICILYVLYVVYYAYYTACATHASI